VSPSRLAQQAKGSEAIVAGRTANANLWVAMACDPPGSNTDAYARTCCSRSKPRPSAIVQARPDRPESNRTSLSMEASDRQRLIHRVSNPSSTARVPIRPVPRYDRRRSTGDEYPNPASRDELPQVAIGGNVEQQHMAQDAACPVYPVPIQSVRTYVSRRIQSQSRGISNPRSARLRWLQPRFMVFRQTWK
jgi:hypothetical protein